MSISSTLTIGDDVLVAAGSTITDDVPNDSSKLWQEQDKQQKKDIGNNHLRI